MLKYFFLFYFFMNSLPQELEIWYLIPALRRELTKIFISDFKLSQKKISEILGITESAVSQYQNSKRAQDLKFAKKENFQRLFLRVYYTHYYLKAKIYKI